MALIKGDLMNIENLIIFMRAELDDINQHLNNLSDLNDELKRKLNEAPLLHPARTSNHEDE